MTTTAAVKFDIGPGTGLCICRGVALVAAAPTDRVVQLLSRAFEEDATFEALVDDLSQLGITSLPPFAVVLLGDEQWHLLQRGDVAMELTGTDGAAVHSERSVARSWREDVVPAGSTVRLALEVTDDELPYHVHGGTFPCSRLSLDVRATRDSVGRAAAPLLADVLSEGAAASLVPDAPVATPEVTPTSDDVAASVVAQVQTSTPAAASVPFVPPPQPPTVAATAPPTLQMLAVDDDAVHAPAPGAPVPVATAAVPPLPPATVSGLDFGNLLDHTVYHRAEDAAVRAEAPSRPSGPSAPAAQPPAATPRPAIDATRTWGDSFTGATQANSADPAAIDLNHDGHTVHRVRTPKSSASASASAAADGTVQAVRCTSGHLNPPAATVCRVCQHPITDRTQLLVQRPSLGVLRFSTGVEVTVTGPIAIGRLPSVATVDGVATQLVTIDNSELSRNHAVVHLAEWYVSVADQGSTNGTKVITPGKPPIVGRPHERMQISPGAIVDLGGAVTFRFDPS